MSKKIAGVTVLYNPDQIVANNIRSYIDNLDILFAVDNSPNDNDNSNLFKFNDKIKYISNHGNLGIAYALNVGANAAVEYGASWLLTMDQDSRFKRGALRILENYLSTLPNDSNVAIVSPIHVLNNDQVALNKTGIEEPLIVMTSGNLVRLDAYKKISGFKDWMFIDAVDFEFCLNLRKNGYNIVQVNDSKLNHKLGNTVVKSFLGHKMSVSNHNAFRRYFIVRNRYYIYDMYADDFPEFCVAERGMTKHELIRILLFEKNKIKKIYEMFRGYVDYRRGIKGGFHGKK